MYLFSEDIVFTLKTQADHTTRMESMFSELKDTQGKRYNYTVKQETLCLHRSTIKKTSNKKNANDYILTLLRRRKKTPSSLR